MPKNENIIEPINADFDKVAQSMLQPARSKAKQNKSFSMKNTSQPATYKQLVLDIGIEIERDINGIEMGVLENGIPFLTQNGLAKITGTARSIIYDIAQQWAENFTNPVLSGDRNSFLKEYLAKNGFNDPSLYIETIKDGTVHYAYPDIVCMAILEYYAFESKSKNAVALDSFRRLAVFGLRKYIYDALGYTPADPWKYWKDRVSLNHSSAPDGYFSIFNAVAGMVVDLISADLPVNDKTIPDISVGICWSMYWKANDLAQKYGERVEYDHYYPSYYPQAMSNPQKPKAYPDAAIPEFKKWFKHEYLTTKFPKYILTKAHLLGGQAVANQIGEMYQPKQIEKK